MKVSEAWGTVSPQRPQWRHGPRVMNRCHNLKDLRREAKRSLPLPVWDYVEGGADEETTLHANLAAFRRWRFQPRSLVDVSEVDVQGSLLGAVLPFPVVLAPTGYTRMVHPRGELEVADAAESLGLPYVVSTVATTPVEAVAQTMNPPPWLQLYLLRDRALSWALLDRAWDSGVRVLELSVDTAVSGRRSRDLAHGFTIPPHLGLRDLAAIAARPRYWTNMLAAPALEFANLHTSEGQSIGEITSQFESDLTWSDLDELRQRWRGTLLIKGPLNSSDAAHAVASGVDGIQLSNHGGRQLDRCLPPIDTVRSVREAVPDTTLIVDSGVRHGMDIAVAIALGADAVGVGRAYLYGLAVNGSSGVRLAIDLLCDEFRRTLQLTGMTSTEDLRKHGMELLSK